MSTLKTDCRYYLGDRPCKPHKDAGVHCDKCDYYSKTSQKILVIKLGAAGDVIRTTPLLTRIKKDYPDSYITWLTDFPAFLPEKMVDQKVQLNERNLFWLSQREFDIVYSLDKDPEAIALCNAITADKKLGFGMDKYGHAIAFDEHAEKKIQTGVWDDIGKANTLSYLEELFNISGYEFSGEKYILDKKVNKDWQLPNDKPIVGFNTGCGVRWPSRLWPESHWEKLANILTEAGYTVLWLGGPQEDEQNTRMSKNSRGIYKGFFKIEEFIDLVDQCDIVVTQVTMALHICLALGKRITLMNNIFNKHEFEMYGLGEIVEPPEGCECYFAPKCRITGKNCMETITPEIILKSVDKQKMLLKKEA